MPRLKLDVDQKTYEWLVERAVDQRRNVDWQAEVELRQAMERASRRARRAERAAATAAAETPSPPMYSTDLELRSDIKNPQQADRLRALLAKGTR